MQPSLLEFPRTSGRTHRALPSSRTLANLAIETYIRQVYQVESEIRALQEQHQQRGEILPGEIVLQLREQKSKPVLEQFKAWVDELLPGTPPNSALGKALAYTTRQWSKLTRHLQHAEIPVDNNYIETANQTLRDGQKILALQLRRGRRASKRQSLLAGRDRSCQWRGAVRVLALSV